MDRYVAWWQHGYIDSTDDCFDIGVTTSAALQAYIGKPSVIHNAWHIARLMLYCGKTAQPQRIDKSV